MSDLKSVISWVHLYQWRDATDVRGDADTKRLGTPAISNMKYFLNLFSPLFFLAFTDISTNLKKRQFYNSFEIYLYQILLRKNKKETYPYKNYENNSFRIALEILVERKKVIKLCKYKEINSYTKILFTALHRENKLT